MHRPGLARCLRQGLDHGRSHRSGGKSPAPARGWHEQNGVKHRMVIMAYARKDFFWDIDCNWAVFCLFEFGRE